MRAKRVTAALSLALLLGAGCTDPGQPSPPPEPVDSLGGASASSEPPPPDIETETATATATPTTEASGAPELPPEATEQTEAGAEAFVAHYFDLLNYGTMTPDADALANTGTPQCQTCVAFQQMLASSAEEETHSDGPALELVDSDAALAAGVAEVRVAAMQLNPAGLDPGGNVVSESRPPHEVEFDFSLGWEESEWRIQEID